MDNKPSLYTLEHSALNLPEPQGRGPVLVHALEGFADAGHGVSQVSRHILDTLDSELIATFAIDDLLDYRSRRPVMTFHDNQFTDYSEPKLSLHSVKDSTGVEFLLLSGLEPDLQWDRFIAAVRNLSERLNVRLTVGINAVPMPVPHSRPLPVTAHSNDKSLLTGFRKWDVDFTVPSSVSMLLEYRLSQAGHRVAGLTAHVPHYLAQMEYPTAAASILRALARVADVAVPVDELDSAAVRVIDQISRHTEANHEVAQVVSALEQQYDANHPTLEALPLLADESSLPTGDEIGAEFERFLAEQGDQED